VPCRGKGKGRPLEKGIKLRTIMRLLATSVNTGLNASLTPSDCRYLLMLISKEVLGQPGTTEDHVNRMIDTLTDLAHNAIIAIGNEIRKGNR